MMYLSLLDVRFHAFPYIVLLHMYHCFPYTLLTHISMAPWNHLISPLRSEHNSRILWHVVPWISSAAYDVVNYTKLFTFMLLPVPLAQVDNQYHQLLEVHEDPELYFMLSAVIHPASVSRDSISAWMLFYQGWEIYRRHWTLKRENSGIELKFSQLLMQRKICVT